MTTEPDSPSDPQQQAAEERLADIKARLREFQKAERARRIRTGTLRPRTHAEITAHLDALDERDARIQRRVRKAARPPTDNHDRPAQPDRSFTAPRA
ncbi:hypothetical protein [Frankia sp. AvcI1]|uniref:hypothetical protein n=1 Tax=Frankia sp. AvcI1 TaxID=573496 RepID=UPI0021186C36|nr:hypothetical protein [Frankia sp. AvcI1]